jgi:hypothetical protein
MNVSRRFVMCSALFFFSLIPWGGASAQVGDCMVCGEYWFEGCGEWGVYMEACGGSDEGHSQCMNWGSCELGGCELPPGDPDCEVMNAPDGATSGSGVLLLAPGLLVQGPGLLGQRDYQEVFSRTCGRAMVRKALTPEERASLRAQSRRILI